jgi:hypothetical protein
MSDHDTTPDTAMATGNDEGDPGEQRDAGPLDAEEQQLLATLEAPDGTPATPAVEDSPAVAAAVDDDAPLPGSTGEGTDGGQGDGLDPEFTDR